VPVPSGYAVGQQSTLLIRSKQKHPSHPGHHARGVQTEQTDLSACGTLQLLPRINRLPRAIAEKCVRLHTKGPKETSYRLFTGEDALTISVEESYGEYPARTP